MSKKGVVGVILLGLLLGMSSVAWAQGEAKDAEIEALKQRVRQLEAQNRAILRQLDELKAEWAGSRVPAASRPAGNRVGEAKDLPANTEHEKLSRAQEPGDDTVKWKELTAGESRLQFYGFLRLDVITDSSRPDFAQTPFYIRSADASLGPGDEESNFTLHPRLTRVGINYVGPGIGPEGRGKLSGQFEVDFQNGGRESRPRFRVRHAYLKMTWGAVSLLGGQTWDIISPLYPTVDNDTLLWNAGNLGDRRPQIRFTYEPKVSGGTFSVVGGVGLTGAVDPKDLDADGVRDGEASGKPNLQSRIGYSRALWSHQARLSVGVSGHYAWEETVTPVGGRRSFRSQSLSLDYSLSWHERVRMKGEAWFGRNLSDFRGGIGQGINRLLGTEVRSRGGWAELGLNLSKYYTIYPGFSIDDPVDRDVLAAGRVRNRVWYIVNRFHPGGPFLVGIDYLRWMTDFKGLQRGVDNRINLYLQYDF